MARRTSLVKTPQPKPIIDPEKLRQFLARPEPPKSYYQSFPMSEPVIEIKPYRGWY